MLGSFPGADGLEFEQLLEMVKDRPELLAMVPESWGHQRVQTTQLLNNNNNNQL